MTRREIRVVPRILSRITPLCPVGRGGFCYWEAAVKTRSAEETAESSRALAKRARSGSARRAAIGAERDIGVIKETPAPQALTSIHAATTESENAERRAR